MDAIDLIRREVRARYAALDTNVHDVTHDMANWRPSGTANSIARTYAHTVISADVDLNLHFYGREPLIRGGWTSRLGIGETFPDDWQQVEIDWDVLHEYGREVAACVERLAAALTQADLDRTFEMVALRSDAPPESLGTWTGLSIYRLHGGNHASMHMGEIACIKGLLGGRGYWPTGD